VHRSILSHVTVTVTVTEKASHLIIQGRPGPCRPPVKQLLPALAQQLLGTCQGQAC
jgi:hypothetical protein